MARRPRASEINADDPLHPLTPGEHRFVHEYLIDENGVRSYMAAYPNASYAAAAVQACVLLKRPNIKANIKAARDAYRKRCFLRADAVLREVARVAFADVGDLFDGQGNLLPIRDIPLDTRKAIQSVKVTGGRLTGRPASGRRRSRTAEIAEIKFWDKLAALEKLCRHLGLTTEITPVEALLASLPRELAAKLAPMITGQTPPAPPA